MKCITSDVINKLNQYFSFILKEKHLIASTPLRYPMIDVRICPIFRSLLFMHVVQGIEDCLIQSPASSNIFLIKAICPKW